MNDQRIQSQHEHQTHENIREWVNMALEQTAQGRFPGASVS